MKYYRVLLSDEYAKRKCKFGILDGKFEDKQLMYRPGRIISKDYSENEILYFEENEGEILADFQMTYFSFNVISQKFRDVLVDFIDDDTIMFPVKVIKDKQEFIYYVVHFNVELDVIDKNKTDDGLLRIVLDMPKLNPDVNVFFTKEFSRGSFAISEKVKIKLDQSGITGAGYSLMYEE